MIHEASASGVTVYSTLLFTGMPITWASGPTLKVNAVSSTEVVPWTMVKTVFTSPTVTVTLPERSAQVSFSETARFRVTSPASPEVWSGTIHSESLSAVHALEAVKVMAGVAASFPTVMVVPAMLRASSGTFSASGWQEMAASPMRAETARKKNFFILYEIKVVMISAHNLFCFCREHFVRPVCTS